MMVHKMRYLLCPVAILAGLSPIVISSMAQKTKSSNSSTCPEFHPYSVSVTASTSTPSDDKPHCFKADPRRSLTFDIRMKGRAPATAAVEIISLDQMKFIVGQAHTSDAAPNMESEVSLPTAIMDGVAKVSFAGESAESERKRPTVIHLGPGPGAGAWVPKSGPYSNVALITISAALKAACKTMQCTNIFTRTRRGRIIRANVLLTRGLNDTTPSGRNSTKGLTDIWQTEHTQESFDRLLLWLDPDRGRAGQRYENIRRKLIGIFASRSAAFPEEMADDCINRVIQKMPELAGTYGGPPEIYFYGVAKMIFLDLHQKTASYGASLHRG